MSLWGTKEILMIEIMLIDNDPADCTNVGPCCYSCPVFDQCDHHYDEDEA
jgi:hypothetical protein